MASAFTPPAPATSFGGRPIALSTRPVPITTAPLRQAPRMQENKKKGFFFNPFARKSKDSEEKNSNTFMQPQAGDPGFEKSASKAKNKDAPESKKQQRKQYEDTMGFEEEESNTLRDIIKQGGSLKRGLELLREDILRNAPERVGVGRQDTDSITIMPVAGEPGYKPTSSQTAKASESGDSPTADAKSANAKVGGVNTVRKAAEEAREKENKKRKEVVIRGARDEKGEKGDKGGKTLQKKTESANVGGGEEQYDLPDYLKPIPEDNPRQGSTWKNYSGR